LWRTRSGGVEVSDIGSGIYIHGPRGDAVRGVSKVVMTTTDHAALIKELRANNAHESYRERTLALMDEAAAALESLSSPAPAAPVDMEALPPVGEFEPNYAEVREAFILGSDEEDSGKDFDLWLARHDASVLAALPSPRRLTAEEVAGRFVTAAGAGHAWTDNETIAKWIDAAGLAVYDTNRAP
jgi:hypothetical protein